LKDLPPLFVDAPAGFLDDQTTDPARVARGPQNIGPHSGGSTGSPAPFTLLISGALNSIAELLGSADRSTNIDAVNCVISGLGAGGALVFGVALVSGAAGSLAGELHETAITTRQAAAAKDLSPLIYPPSPSQLSIAPVGDGRVRNSLNDVDFPCG
jgi:hypothetical protein